MWGGALRRGRSLERPRCYRDTNGQAEIWHWPPVIMGAGCCTLRLPCSSRSRSASGRRARAGRTSELFGEVPRL